MVALIQSDDIPALSLESMQNPAMRDLSGTLRQHHWQDKGPRASKESTWLVRRERERERKRDRETERKQTRRKDT